MQLMGQIEPKLPQGGMQQMSENRFGWGLERRNKIQVFTGNIPESGNQMFVAHNS